MIQHKALLAVAAIVLIAIAVWTAASYYLSKTNHRPSLSDSIGATATKPKNTPAKTPETRVVTATATQPVSTENIISKFKNSTNLADFIAENSAAAKNGDGKAARLIKAAYAECASIGKDSADYVNFMMSTVGNTITDAIKRDAYQTALRGEVSRCSSLNSTGYPSGTIKYWADLAAKQGDLSSEVSSVLPVKNSDVKQIDVQNLVAKIVSAKDGDAMAQLGSVMATASTAQSNIYGKYSGHESDAYLWQLTACSFGADCSTNGLLLRNMCLASGMCGYATLDDAFRNLLPPYEYDQIVQQQAALVATLQQGDVSGLY